ncbi:MAG TPA: sigma-70 family RNA polymerase sigma factor [Chitinophagaceae bacterium]|nr:sigma-70 family RNA polymerase sigma factor [Chitinophagaceae bacterium]
MQVIMDINNPGTTVKCWVDMYADNMYSWALYKTGNKEIAEDLVQDCFIAAFQAMEKFSGKSDVKTWLFAILNNKIAEYFRKQFRSSRVFTSEGTATSNFFEADGSWLKNQRPQEWTDDETQLLDNNEFKKILQSCMDNLPGHWNAALQLKYLEEKKGEIICQELGITATNFWQVLHRAKLQLRKCLENHWFNK